MPDNQPPFQHPVLPQPQRACLPGHLQDGGGGHRKIVRGAGAGLRQGGIHKLQVRQVDVHQPLQQPEALRLLVPAGVVDHRDLQPSPGLLQRLDDLGEVLGGADQVDVPGPGLLEL